MAVMERMFKRAFLLNKLPEWVLLFCSGPVPVKSETEFQCKLRMT